MKDFVWYLVKQIVDNPDSASVVETQQMGETVLEITVAPEDMGKIIGKAGKIIKSIRELARVLAVKNGLRVMVVLKE